MPLRLVGPVETPFATVTLEQFEELAVPRLLIKTRMGKIDEVGIAQVLATLDMALARGHPLTIAYDLRTAPIPSRKQIGIALDWIGKNAPLLDVQLQGVAIVLSSPIVRSVVNFVLLLTQPPQPNGCFGDEAAAFAFARSKCSEIRVWVGAGKAKQLQRQASEPPLGTPDSPRRSSWLSFGGSPAPSRASASVPDTLEAEAGGADSTSHTRGEAREVAAPVVPASKLRIEMEEDAEAEARSLASLAVENPARFGGTPKPPGLKRASTSW